MADTKKTTAKAPKVTKVSKKVDATKSLAELQEELRVQRAEHNESRKSHRAGELVNPHVLTEKRKKIARLLTAINAAQQTAQKEEN